MTPLPVTGVVTSRKSNRHSSIVAATAGKDRVSDEAAQAAKKAGEADADLGQSLQWSTNPLTASLTKEKRKGDVVYDSRGMPVREGVQALYKIYRSKAMRELGIFLLNFALFYFMAWEVYDPHDGFTTSDALIDLFLDEEFEGYNYKKNFEELRSMDDVWEWIEGPMYNGLYNTEWYNGDAYTEDELGYVLGYFRLVGGVQLRQLRVSNHSCTERRFVDETAEHINPVTGEVEALGRFDTPDGTCYAEFTASTQDTEPFGPPEDPDRYTWSDGHHSLDGLFGFGPAYGTGGFVTVLPIDHNLAAETLQQLKADGWTDRGTRAISVSFSLYNTQTKLLTSARVLFEFFNSGLTLPSYKFFTVKMVVYESKLDGLRSVVEFVYLGFVLYYLQHELRHISHQKRKIMYFSKAQNFFEVTLIVVNLIGALSWARFVADPLRQSFDVNSPTFVDTYDLAEAFVSTFTWAGGIGLCYALKMFKFLAVSRKMATVFLTLSRAFSDLAAFMFCFLLVVAGFALMANFLFGHLLVKYHTVTASFSTLLRYPLGDFEYGDLSRARPALASGFFTTYNVMVFLVIMNMFIGIITKYFDEVHEEVKKHDSWKTSMIGWEGEIWISWAHMFRKFMRSLRRTGRDPFRDAEEQDAINKAEAAFRRQKAFYDALHKSMRSAKLRNNIELYPYFEALYQSAECDNLHIGVAEICSLVQRTPCDSHDSCLAHDLVEAFNKMKVVMLMGTVRAHKPITAHVATDRTSYDVLKYSSNGLPSRRFLVVYKQRGLLLNFDKHMRLRKRLPLRQLLQIEKSTLDSRRLGMVFTARGMSFEDERKAGAGIMETYYELSFTEGGQWREHFVDSILEALREGPKTMRTLSGEHEDDKTTTAQAAGGSLADMARRSAGGDAIRGARRDGSSSPNRELLSKLTTRAAGVFSMAGASFRRRKEGTSSPSSKLTASDVAVTKAALARLEMLATGGIAPQAKSVGSAKSLGMQITALKAEVNGLGSGESLSGSARGMLEALEAADKKLQVLAGAGSRPPGRP